MTDRELARIRARWVTDGEHGPEWVRIPYGPDKVLLSGARPLTQTQQLAVDLMALLAEVERLNAEARRMTALHAQTVEELDAARADHESVTLFALGFLIGIRGRIASRYQMDTLPDDINGAIQRIQARALLARDEGAGEGSAEVVG